MRGKNSFECIFIFCRIQFENLQNNYKCFFLHRDPLSLSLSHTLAQDLARTHMHEHMDMHTRSHLRMHKHALYLCWHKFDACWWHHQFCKTWCGSKIGLDKRLQLKWLNEHRWQWRVEGSNPIDSGGWQLKPELLGAPWKLYFQFSIYEMCPNSSSNVK